MKTSTTPRKSIKAKLVIAGITSAALLGFAIPAAASAATYTVCKHGCKIRTITAAVNKAKGGDTIKVKPGTYPESVYIKGSKYDNLKIFGTTAVKSKMPLLTGTRARPQTDFGILAEGVDGFQLKNLRGANYTGTAFFVRGDYGNTGPTTPCTGYKFSNLVAWNNVKYGLYARNCVGGQMTRSEAYLNGDAGVYIGETPEQVSPVWTDLSYLNMHQNVLGYSGTNSRYVDINNSDFYNNGAGIVPNTLDSEGFEPTANGKIRENRIFWNNFNYYATCAGSKTGNTPACSPIPRSWVGNLGTVGGIFRIYYPTGIGVVLHGSSGWEVTDNQIFGNNKWGVAAVSDPFNDGNDATGNDNQIRDNTLGRAGTDPNGYDFFWDYAGSNNCFSGNGSFTAQNGSSNPSVSNGNLYPTSCPGSTGTGTKDANEGQFNLLLDLVTGGLNTYPSSADPEKMQCLWGRSPSESHPAYTGFTYYRVTKAIACS